MTTVPCAHILAQVWTAQGRIALSCPFWMLVSVFPLNSRADILDVNSDLLLIFCLLLVGASVLVLLAEFCVSNSLLDIG